MSSIRYKTYSIPINYLVKNPEKPPEFMCVKYSFIELYGKIFSGFSSIEYSSLSGKDFDKKNVANFNFKFLTIGILIKILSWIIFLVSLIAFLLSIQFILSGLGIFLTIFSLIIFFALFFLIQLGLSFFSDWLFVLVAMKFPEKNGWLMDDNDLKKLMSFF